MALSFSLFSCCFCCFERGAQHVLTLQCSQIIAAKTAGDLLHLYLNLRIDFLDLIVQLRQLRIGGSELRAQLSNLNFQISFLLLQLFQQRRGVLGSLVLRTPAATAAADSVSRLPPGGIPILFAFVPTPPQSALYSVHPAWR